MIDNKKTYELVIEKNVPVPPKKKINTRWSIAENMEIGDSVLVATQMDSLSLHNYCRRKGFRSTSRKVEGGYRVWRIEW